MPNEAAIVGYVLSGLLLLAGIVVVLWPKVKGSGGEGMVEEKDKPDIQVTSIGQRGGITAGVVNIQADEPPRVHVEEIGYRQEDGKHVYEAMLTVETRYPVPQIQLIARADSILGLDVAPQRSGMVMFGHSGKREGWHFTTLQNAYGAYKIRVTTAQPENVRIELT